MQVAQTGSGDVTRVTLAQAVSLHPSIPLALNDHTRHEHIAQATFYLSIGWLSVKGSLQIARKLRCTLPDQEGNISYCPTTG